jgi:hypothetical protein
MRLKGDPVEPGKPQEMHPTTYYIGCWDKQGHRWREQRTRMVGACPEGHRAMRMKVKMRCKQCGWEGWFHSIQQCSLRHKVQIIDYGPA